MEKSKAIPTATPTTAPESLNEMPLAFEKLSPSEGSVNEPRASSSDQELAGRDEEGSQPITETARPRKPLNANDELDSDQTSP